MFAERNNPTLAAQMVVFAAVVREGGMTAAARALGLSKASVSKQISQLEEVMGTRLLQRTTRLVRPTEAGNLFYERCAEVTRLVEEANGLLSSLQDEVLGLLRISVPSSFGRAFLEQPIASFIARFPRLRVELDMTDSQVDLLAEGYDLTVRVGAIHDPELITRTLCHSRKRVVVAPSLLAELGPLTDPFALSDHPCLLYSHQVPRDRWVLRHREEPLEIPVAGRIKSGSGEFLAAAAVQGLGFAWLPDFIVKEHLRSGALVSVLDAYSEEDLQVRAVLPARKFIPLQVQVFLEHLQAALKSVEDNA